MKKINLLLSLIVIGSLVSCAKTSNTSSDAEPIVIEDLIGRKVSITPGSYKRVVCIGAGALRLYSYIGDTSLLSGIEDIDNESLSSRPKMFDSAARPYVMANREIFSSLPSCGVGGPSAQSAEAEKILTCSPDIVISQYEDVQKENALQKELGVPVVTLRIGSKGVFDEHVKTSLSLLGTIFGKEDKAEKLNTYIENQKKEIEDAVSSVKEEDKKNVYICGLGNWGTTSYLMTAQNYEPFNVASVKNVISGLSADGVQAIEKEKFIDIGKDIDIMIFDAAAYKNTKALYQEDKTIFDECKAWKEGEVYLQLPYNAYYTNLEIALCNTWYNAKVVYPDLFSSLDINNKMNEITSAFLGKELADEINACTLSFGGYQKIDTSSFFE